MDSDIFDNVVLCKECGKRMERISVNKSGFQLRALYCQKCNKKIFHPGDIEEYKRFTNLKQRQFHVKLRMVGNSYAVSIPRDIIDFINETEEFHKKMQRMVTLAFEHTNKLALMFGSSGSDEKDQMADKNGLGDNFINSKHLNLRGKKWKNLN